MLDRFPCPFEAIADRLAQYRRADIFLDIDPCEDMLIGGERGDVIEHYFSVGRSAIEVIARAMVLGNLSTVRTVLDLPCGGGRVLRHLAAFLPEAEIFAGDANPLKVAAMQKQFGAHPIDAGDFRMPPPRRFDLIWSASLLTHLDETPFRLALTWFAAALEHDGVAIITLHGRRHAEHELRRPQIPPSRWWPMEAGYIRRGFGYAPDYPGAEIGMTLSSASFVAGLVQDMPGVRLIGYHEAGWVDDQDVLVLQRRSIS